MDSKNSQNIPPIIPNKKHARRKAGKKIISAISIGSLPIILILLAAYFTNMFQDQESSALTSSPETNQVSQQDQPTQTQKYQILDNTVVTSFSGVSIAIENEWNVSVVQSSPDHSLVIGRSDEGYEIQFEVISHNIPNWQNLVENNLAKIENSEDRIVAGNSVNISRGSENFANASRRFIQGHWNLSGKSAYLRVFSSNEDQLENVFDSYSKTINSAGGSTSQINLIKNVYAQSTNIPKNLPQIEYKVAEVMGEPLVDKITTSDPAYRDGYLKAYKFLAFKSQTLATYAVEDRESNPGSFIRSQVFDRNGAQLTRRMDTHTEFYAPYTGEYYLLVWSFDNQIGQYTLRIDDHDQLSCQTLMKYPDGAELKINHEVPMDLLVGYYSVGYIRQCPTAIKILEGNQIENMVIGRESDQTSHNKTWTVSVYSSPDLFKPKEGVESTFIPAADNPQNTTYHDIQIQQLGTNRILITPEGGLFEKGRQYNVQNWNDRFFTQDKPTAPDLPIIKDLTTSFDGDFATTDGKYEPELVVGEYFDWDDAGTTIELLGAKLTHREDEEVTNYTPEERLKTLYELGDKYIEYLLSKGYSQNEENTYFDDSVKSANPWRTKRVTGLQLNQTVCKIIVDNGRTGPSIYCSTL